MKDYYDILGLGHDATKDDIRSNYRSLAKKYHADAGSGSDDMMKEINEAYDVLSDPKKRRDYDLGMDLGQRVDDAYSGREGSRDEVSYRYFDPKKVERWLPYLGALHWIRMMENDRLSYRPIPSGRFIVWNGIYNAALSLATPLIISEVPRIVYKGVEFFYRMKLDNILLNLDQSV